MYNLLTWLSAEFLLRLLLVAQDIHRLTHFHIQGVLFLGNCPIDVPLARLQAGVHFYEAAENETRQLENWINYKMMVVSKKNWVPS
jgi:hypothetical protein